MTGEEGEKEDFFLCLSLLLEHVDSCEQDNEVFSHFFLQKKQNKTILVMTILTGKDNRSFTGRKK